MPGGGTVTDRDEASVTPENAPPLPPTGGGGLDILVALAFTAMAGGLLALGLGRRRREA